MVMEAITASLRDLEIEQVYQNQTSKSTENYSHQKNPEAPFPDTPQGSDKELVQAATCTEVNTSSCMSVSQTQCSSVDAATEQVHADSSSTRSPSIGILEGLSHRWGIGLFRNGQ
eukprot:Gb_02152 [translate_table: standard]